jgi:hypothetical protein
MVMGVMYGAGGGRRHGARITAERLVQHLEASGFVLMKGPPRVAPTTGGMPPGRGLG